jgi:two-component system alkaline phosphatase synthesis response regulator PhoP
MGGQRILVVDDDVHMVRLMEYNLVRSGYQVCVAYNGKEAIEKASKDIPDVILLDIRMPVMDGFEVCKALRASHVTSGIPIVIVSVTADKEKAEIMGARSYILKPFTPKHLIEEVKEVLEETGRSDAKPALRN